MDLRVRQGDCVRVIASHKDDNFIDISYTGYESIAVDMYPTFHYIEARLKENRLRVFLFKNKSHKKECDFGFWDDAEVVFSLNKTFCE